jgi:hypothetical protein
LLEDIYPIATGGKVAIECCLGEKLGECRPKTERSGSRRHLKSRREAIYNNLRLPLSERLSFVFVLHRIMQEFKTKKKENATQDF